MDTPVYMDYHATTPVDSRVVDAMLPFFSETFGNPASRQHRYGWAAEQAVEASRGSIARHLGAQPREIVVTSGATEANNLALKGVAEASQRRGAHIITVQTEHKSVLDSARRLEKAGYRVTYLPVDGEGLLDLNRLAEAVTPETVLVSVMMANNEIGTIQPVAEIGAFCRERHIVFHTDATQAVGLLPVNVESMKIDLLSCTGHKVYGPKGVGVLYVRSTNPRVRLAPQIDGGGHERGMRSGTLNVPGIVGMAKALELCAADEPGAAVRLAALRDRLWSMLGSELDEILLNGHPVRRLPNNLNVSFLHVEDNALMMSMKDVAVSTGSACSTADPEPSHVLKALRLAPERLHSALRFGLGRFTTAEEVDFVAHRVVESVRKLRQLSPAYRTTTEGIPHERS